MASTNIRFSNINSYYKIIAIDHVSIAHDDDTNKAFYRLDINEILGALKAGAATTILVIENFDGKFSANPGQNYLNNMNFAFSVLTILTTPGDFDEQNAILDSTYEICKDIIDRMWADKLAKNTPMIIFELDSVSYNKVEMWNQYHGWRVSCQFSNPQTIKINTSVWKSGYNPKKF